MLAIGELMALVKRGIDYGSIMFTISFPLNWWFTALKSYACFCPSYFVSSLETFLALI